MLLKKILVTLFFYKLIIMKDKLKNIIITHSQELGSWSNSDSEFIDSDERSFDTDDLNCMINDILNLFLKTSEGENNNDTKRTKT